MASLAFFASGPLASQQAQGGRESPFSIGYSARALGLGNAQTAYPGDPMAFYWNPGGMVCVDYKSVSFNHTVLFEDVLYSSVGFVYPTLSAGTFGLGVAGIWVGGIHRMEFDRGTPVSMGDMQYWWGKLTVSYAIPLVKGFSLGVNFNEHRQVLGPYASYGFGMDAGLHFGSTAKRGLFKDWFFGLAASNALPARLKLGTAAEKIPMSIRGGLAKAFVIRGGADRLLLIGDVDRTENQESRLHAGLEYAWDGLLFLRGGMNDRNAVFGGGIRLRAFQMDYAYAQFGDPAHFPKSHRFSLVFYMGKSIPQQRRMLEEARLREIEGRIEEQRTLDRNKRIQDGLQAGRSYFASADYFHARLELSRVLTEDPENREAQQLLTETTERENTLQRQHEEVMLQEAKETEKQLQDQAFVNERFQQGLDALNRGEYAQAVPQWEQALERDPENTQIRTYLDNTRQLLVRDVERLVARSKALEREDRLTDAYKLLEQARDMASVNPNLRNTVAAEIKRLDAKLGSVNAFQAGLDRYAKGDFQAATQFFERVLAYEPQNQRAFELHRNAKARSVGVTRDMTQTVKEKFSLGLKYFQDGRYQDAIRVWEQALESDPNNIKILDAIQAAKDKLATVQKQP